MDFIAEKADALMHDDEHHRHDSFNVHMMHNDTKALRHAVYERSLHRATVDQNSFSRKNTSDERARTQLNWVLVGFPLHFQSLLSELIRTMQLQMARITII